MITIASYRIPYHFKRFRPIDPIVLITKLKRLSYDRYLALWKYVMESLIINGVYKTTYSNRLHISTQYLNDFYYVKRERISFLEVGSSDGSSSFYTHCFLKRNGIDINTISTDKYTSIFYSKSFFLRYYFTSDNIPFSCIIMNFFYYDLRNKSENQHNIIVNKLLSKFYKKKYFINRKTISLIHPEIKTDCTFIYETLDVLNINKKFIDKFNVIRCSNLLQLAYFDRKEILMALEVLKMYLNENGLLIITRDVNEELKESGVVFQKRSNDLVIIHRFSMESEIEKIYYNK
jgi:hypothetical protein